MILLSLIVGLSGGLVINYLADVLPATRKLAKPDWWPVNAKSLKQYFSRPRVLIVFVVSLAVTDLVNQNPPIEFPSYLFLLVLAYFLLVTVIDIEHRVVMHPVSLVGALLMGGIGIWRHGGVNTMIGGAVGFGFMLALFYLGELLGRLMARARKESWEETALGFGDVNLSGVIGLLMGWPGVIGALFFGMVAAGIFSAGFLLVTIANRKYRAFASIPYAPFLCLGTVAVIVVSVYM